MPHHQDDDAFKDLWARRRGLTQAEWTRLYEIVFAALASYRPEILGSLNEEHDVYVQEFFQDKVLRTDLFSRLDHVGALRVAYKRYLHDRYDSERLRRTEELAGDDGEQAGAAVGNPGPGGDEDEDFRALADAGIPLSAVSESAARWLREAESWVPTMLGLHHCPDRDHSEPLVRLASRLGIRSYHYKAEKLGITGIRNETWGKETLLGQWVARGLNIEISLENRRLVSAALKILCHEALIWAEQQEAAR